MCPRKFIIVQCIKNYPRPKRAESNQRCSCSKIIISVLLFHDTWKIDGDTSGRNEPASIYNGYPNYELYFVHFSFKNLPVFSRRRTTVFFPEFPLIYYLFLKFSNGLRSARPRPALAENTTAGRQFKT